MINDLISDGLTRIRNAAMRRLDTTKLLHSKVVEATLSILAAKGYIESYNVVEENNKKFINVVLKYDERGRSVINEIKRIQTFDDDYEITGEFVDQWRQIGNAVPVNLVKIIALSINQQIFGGEI